ncbi:MAG: zf-HC2 domain-containing protein [Acidobacteriota bacterium]|nr:zf-HC2 domain-containing protein [Acidobacteriota bacterium]
MRCEECLPLVEEYFDGELDESVVNLVAQHINACAHCAREHQKLESERELYLSYVYDAEAAPDFWDNIMTRAAREKGAQSNLFERFQHFVTSARGDFSAPRFSAALTALIVLAAVVTTAGLMLYINSRGRSVGTAERIPSKESQPSTATSTAPGQVDVQDESSKTAGAGREEIRKDLNKRQLARGRDERKGSQAVSIQRGAFARSFTKPGSRPSELTPDQLIREAEQKYLAAISMLSRDVSRRRSRLDSETVTRFERTLAEIDRTIADTRRAVREHPGDPLAAQYMLTAYAKKVDVLREMIGY